MLVTIRQRCVRLAAAAVLCGAWAAGSAEGGPDRRLPDAAKDRDWARVGALLDRGVHVDTAQGDGATALHWAAHWNALRAVDRLIAAGADVDAANELGATPLWVACASRNTEVVERLLTAGADADRGLLAGETALMRCAATGDPAAARALVEHGAEVDATEPENGQTALMWAAAHRQPDVAAVLLEHGAAVDARTLTRRQFRGTGLRSTTSPAGSEYFEAGGFTPLLFAARHGDVDTARLSRRSTCTTARPRSRPSPSNRPTERRPGREGEGEAGAGLTGRECEGRRQRSGRDALRRAVRPGGPAGRAPRPRQVGLVHAPSGRAAAFRHRKLHRPAAARRGRPRSTGDAGSRARHSARLRQRAVSLPPLRRYADKHRHRGKPIHLIGVEFSSARRNVAAFDVERAG